MIKSFSHKGLEQLHRKGTTKGVQARHAQVLLDILDLLEAAEHPGDMDFPGSRFHPYKGVADTYSVDVQAAWRVVFEFRDGNAYKVDYCNPH
jgi:toxin HigB-1